MIENYLVKKLPDGLCKPNDKKFLDSDEHPTLENSLIIIDEAHKILNPSKKAEKMYAKIILRGIRRANNIRVLLLTATPIDKEPYEIGILLNLLKRKDSRTRFPEVYDKDGLLNKEETKKAFEQQFY